MNLRLVSFLFLAGLFLLVGVALTQGVPPNRILGVRTALTFSNAQLWRAVNGGAGILMMAVSYLAFYAVAARVESPTVAFATLLVSIVCVALISASSPQVPAAVYSIAVPAPRDVSGAHARLAAAFGVQLLAGCAGFLLWKGKVAPNRFPGPRLRALTGNDRAWYRGNRIAGLCLYAGSAVSVAILGVALVRGAPSRQLLWGSVLWLAFMAVACWFAAMAALIHDSKGEP
jgi:hypothetical protein